MASEPQREKFIPCNRETDGGAQKPGMGTTCGSGVLMFWAMYNGKMERFARDCDCLRAWRARNVTKGAA